MNRPTLFSRLAESILVIGKEVHGEHAMQLPAGVICSPAQKIALMNIAAHGPMSIKDLAGQLRVTSAAATQHVDALEKHDLVSRHINLNDRREMVIAITTEGHTAAQASKHMQSRMFNNLFSNLDDTELGTLVELMEKVSEKYKGSKEKNI